MTTVELRHETVVAIQLRAQHDATHKNNNSPRAAQGKVLCRVHSRKVAGKGPDHNPEAPSSGQGKVDVQKGGN